MLRWFRRQQRVARRAREQAAHAGYPGDFTGKVRLEYRPVPDGRPDPGEVVWGWVPFEEDHSRARTGQCW